MENRNGLIAAAMTTQADGRAERDAALLMLHELARGGRGRITTGADKAYDTRDFVSTVRELGVTRTWPDDKTERSKSERAGIRVTRSVSANAGWWRNLSAG